MRIPTHQIHNVLNAYARRLKKNHDAGNGPVSDVPEKNRINAYSVEAKRRWIINKISKDIIERIARMGPNRQTGRQTSPNSAAADSHPVQTHPSADPLSTDLIRYNIITPEGEKISVDLKMQDSEFLIRQLEKIARNAKKN